MASGQVKATGPGPSWTPDALASIPNRLLYEELQRRRQSWQHAYHKKTHQGPFESLVAGVVSGCVTRTATSPLDVIRILFQLQTSAIRKGGGGYEGMGHALTKIVKEEGITGLWKGNAIGCMRLAPYAGMKFMVYDGAKTHFSSSGSNTFSNWERVWWGGVAGIAANMITYPLEVVRTRVILQRPGQDEKHRYTGTWDALRRIRAAEGTRGWFKGAFTGCVGVVPFEGVQFACYEGLKDYAIEHRWPRWRWSEDKHAFEAIDYLVIGSLAGAVAQTVSYPFDLVKRRLQVQADAAGGGTGVRAVKYKGMVHCFRVIVKEEGVAGLFKGTLPNLVKVVPYAAVMFSSYELLLKTFNWYNQTNLDARWDEFLSETGTVGDPSLAGVGFIDEDEEVENQSHEGEGKGDEGEHQLSLRVLPSEELN